MSAATGANGAVLFLIGMRINRLWQPWRWLPVFVAMPKMIAELQRHPELGLAARPRTFLSGRTVMVVQYWRSFESLEAYASASDREHLPAWRNFNRRLRPSGAVGIFHETYLLSDDGVETLYANMPRFGLAGLTGGVPTARRGESAGARLGRPDDAPPVAPD